MLIFLLAALENEEDRRKFTAVYEQYHTRLENAAIGILKNQTDAEDAVQNTFVQIIRHFEKISQIPCEELPFWLISIVKNESLMILRKRSRTVPLPDLESLTSEAEAVNGYPVKCPLSSRQNREKEKKGRDYQKMVSVLICLQQPRIPWVSYSQVSSGIVHSCKNGCMQQSHYKADRTRQNDTNSTSQISKFPKSPP